jgi:putative copper resistance protein D
VENDAVHNLEHALYLITGYLYFLPVIGSEPIRWRISVLARYILLAATMPADIAVGIILTMVPHEIFPAYAHTDHAWGPSLVTDLHDGGWMMFIGSDIVMTILGLAMAVRFVTGTRRSDRTVPWVERLRSAAMLHEIGAAGVTVPGGPAAGRTVDDGDGAYLGAYNAYLATLGDRDQQRHRNPAGER